MIRCEASASSAVVIALPNGLAPGPNSAYVSHWMHELAITESIIAIAETAARENGAAHITRIKVRIGEFTGIVREALEFCFEVARQGTLAETATLEVEVVPLRKRCSACDKISEGGFDFFCPDCRMPVEILAGRELQIDFIDLD